jgi:predicted nucleotidyltransferase
LPKQTSKETTADLRHKIAREAAILLYFGSEKEYKQAKLKAAQNIGVHILPSNLEVALELDKVAQETEGPARTQRLIQMRTEALKMMKLLKEYSPILIGSVWRGTIRRGSDIDIETYHDEPEEIVPIIKAGGLEISRKERTTVTEHGKTETSLHIYAESSEKCPIEIVVRPLEETGRKRTCDTFGDQIKGVTIRELEKLLKANPAQTFIPS